MSDTPLTDAQLDYATARRVMGYGACSAHGEAAWSVPISPNSGEVIFASQWRPSTYIADAWKVLEHVRRDSDSVVLQTLKDRWVCSINGKIYAMGVGDTAPRAICLAALAAVGAQP